jgi:hypothetical protein
MAECFITVPQRTSLSHGKDVWFVLTGIARPLYTPRRFATSISHFFHIHPISLAITHNTHPIGTLNVNVQSAPGRPKSKAIPTTMTVSGGVPSEMVGQIQMFKS